MACFDSSGAGITGLLTPLCKVLWSEKKCVLYTGADKSVVRPGRKQATATEDFDVHISYLLP